MKTAAMVAVSCARSTTACQPGDVLRKCCMAFSDKFGGIRVRGALATHLLSSLYLSAVIINNERPARAARPHRLCTYLTVRLTCAPTTISRSQPRSPVLRLRVEGRQARLTTLCIATAHPSCRRADPRESMHHKSLLYTGRLPARSQCGRVRRWIHRVIANTRLTLEHIHKAR